MRKTTTISEIITRAAAQLDGIGLDERLLEEATTDLENDLERIAGAALRKVLTRHIAQLSPMKKARKSQRTSTQLESAVDV